jgi:hypothetical protein
MIRSGTAVSLAQLRLAEPRRWLDTAVGWRDWAATAGRWAAELRAHAARLRTIWRGAAADAVTARLASLSYRLDLFRLGCWAADQALSEFAAALARARALLPAPPQGPTSETTHSGGTNRPDPTGGLSAPPASAAGDALALAAQADATAADRLAATREATGAAMRGTTGDTAGRTAGSPPCTATPAEVRRWWDGLAPAEQHRLIATEAEWIGARDGVPAAARDLANRLALDALSQHRPGDAQPLARTGAPVPGLGELRDRLAAGTGPRAYLLRLDPAGDGRAVVALGDPDRAAHVLTQVPGMTADLASYQGELVRAERIAERAAELAPAAASSAIMWLGYDAPDFVDEAASRAPAEAGAVELRRFQEGLRATHDGVPAHQTVLGHSYGSLVVGRAAAEPGLAADDVVFVGSPGVGADSAAELRVPAGRVWASTSWSDVIQWAAVSPGSLAEDLAVSRLPGGALVAFGRPEDNLYFGTNPSDPAFGARVFASPPGAGHLGYWAEGSALDALTNIAVGRGDVIPR